MKKQLPIGCSDFKKLIDKNYYYIDKTLFVDDILRCDGEIILLPRPRRFGKTLNISMLKYFFESSYAHPSPRLWVTGKATEDKKTQQSHAYLFEDKKIWQLPERRALQGKFPVIFLTFKDIKQSTWEMTHAKLVTAIAAEYTRHDYLLASKFLNKLPFVLNSLRQNQEDNDDVHILLLWLQLISHASFPKYFA